MSHCPYIQAVAKTACHHKILMPIFDNFFFKKSSRHVRIISCDIVDCSSYQYYSFTGKERDEETGYSYFGARYYDPDLSGIFFSVDPMSDKYPGISPYAYCAWNPLKLVDPDGRDVWEVDKNG